jgi:hypothetical protein
MRYYYSYSFRTVWAIIRAVCTRKSHLIFAVTEHGMRTSVSACPNGYILIAMSPSN